MTAPVSDPSTAPLQFAYEAQTVTGQAIRGTLEAVSAAAADAQLAALGLRILRVEPAPLDGKPRRPPLGPDDFLLFNQQLAHMTAAGLPIDRGLRLIAADLKSGRLSAAANAVAADLENGASLHDAFAAHASRFPSLYARLVEAGVKSNNLPALLFNFGRHLELQARLRRTLWRTLSYPAAVLVALSAVLVFISIYILPQMREIYVDFRTTLPDLTMAVLWIGPKIPYVAGGLLLLVLASTVLMLALRAAGRDGPIVDAIALGMPLVGPVIRRSLLARWCDALRISIEAGLDLPRAIELAAQAVGSPRLMRESAELAAVLSTGGPLLGFQGRILPPVVPAAIDFAGRSGDLAFTLATLARMYEQQTEQRLRALPAILTPLFLAFLGTIVAMTIIAMFLPLLKLLQSLSGGGSE